MTLNCNSSINVIILQMITSGICFMFLWSIKDYEFFQCGEFCVSVVDTSTVMQSTCPRRMYKTCALFAVQFVALCGMYLSKRYLQRPGMPSRAQTSITNLDEHTGIDNITDVNKSHQSAKSRV